MNIEIDPASGFCFGVVYAIKKAEEELDKNNFLYCLGDIVHNNVEMERLKSRGLVTINHEELRDLKNCKVLIRAHGEPPGTYEIAKQNNIQLIDATCPVVLRLQHKIRIGNEEIQARDGQVVIYGKEGHAEVNGLVGQTKGKAIVVNKEEDLEKIDFSKPIIMFSQTTQGLEGYAIIQQKIRNRIKEAGLNPDKSFTAYDTICRQVSSRSEELQAFARKHDIIIFVSGKKSSNGQMLFSICKNANLKTYFVSDENEIMEEWFINMQSVGICGATSTPRWLMENISTKIKSLSI